MREDFSEVAVELPEVDVAVALVVHECKAKLVLFFVRPVAEHVHDLGVLFKSNHSALAHVKNFKYAVS